MIYNFRQTVFQTYLRTSCIKVNGIELAMYEIDTLSCHFYPLGDAIIERIGPTSYMLRFDSGRKDLYGGPLLWYYDPEIGLYEQGKTNIEHCEFETSKDTNIFTGIDDQMIIEMALKMYPFPFAGNLRLENQTDATSAIFIYTLNGECLHNERILGNESKNISTESWPPGIYIVKQQTTNGISTMKIVKQ